MGGLGTHPLMPGRACFSRLDTQQRGDVRLATAWLLVLAPGMATDHRLIECHSQSQSQSQMSTREPRVKARPPQRPCDCAPARSPRMKVPVPTCLMDRPCASSTTSSPARGAAR